MNVGERCFELLLGLAIGLCLWNVIVAEATRGIYADVQGQPLRGSRLGEPADRRAAGHRAVMRLGARGVPEKGDGLEVDRAVLRMVTARWQSSEPARQRQQQPQDVRHRAGIDDAGDQIEQTSEAGE